MRIFVLAFAGFILSGLFLLPLLNEQLAPPDSYLIYGPLALMVITLLLQIDAAITYRKLLAARKLEADNDALTAELKDANAKLHTEKKALTTLRTQLAQQEREVREASQKRSALANELQQAKDEREARQRAFDDAVKKQRALEEELAKTKETMQSGQQEVVHLLTLLQEKGRFIDFLMDDITKYPDAQIGAAARVVHRGCSQVIDDYFAITPVSEVKEGSRISVGERYHPKEYRFLGKVTEPPFQGTVLHRGWCTSKVKLPQLVDADTLTLPSGAQVITPAEIELS